MPRARRLTPASNGHDNTPDPAQTPAPPSHNETGGLTDEEASALTTHYALKIIADARKVDLRKSSSTRPAP